MQWEVLVEQEFSWSLFQEQWSFYFQQCLLIGKGTNTAVIYIVLNQCHPWTYHTGINSHVGHSKSPRLLFTCRGHLCGHVVKNMEFENAKVLIVLFC